MSPVAPPPRPRSLPASAATLHAETAGEGPRVVMAHGFTQTSRVWGGLDTRLIDDHRLTVVDMPGHAGSSGIAATLDEGAGQLVHVGGRATYLGYSMGARFCLHAALAFPRRIEQLILISATAGIDDPDERRHRRQADEALAEELDPEDGRSGLAIPVEEFIRRWLDGPLFVGISAEAGGFEERLRNTGPGLASSLRLAGTGTQQPQWDRLGDLAMPVLVITGDRDERFTILGQRLVEAIGPNADLVVIPGAGHAPHLQQPDLVARAVRSMTSDTPRS